MKKLLFAMIILCEGHITSFADNIKFADSAVKNNSDPTTISLDLVTGAMTINGEAQASTKGDINHDGKVNISDVTTLVDIILGK